MPANKDVLGGIVDQYDGGGRATAGRDNHAVDVDTFGRQHLQHLPPVVIVANRAQGLGPQPQPGGQDERITGAAGLEDYIARRLVFLGPDG